MTNEEFSQRFLLEDENNFSSWTEEELDSFRSVAQRAHDAGWDWYWIAANGNRPQIRFGRKEKGQNGNVAGIVTRKNDGLRLRFRKGAGGEFDRSSVPLSTPIPEDLDQRLQSVVPPRCQPSIRTDLSRTPYWPIDLLADRTMPDNGDDDEPSANGERQSMDIPYVPKPRNLILYGPPGTGKTYATSRHAVALVDGDEWLDELLHDRDAVRARYAELVATKQIEFVTFHQSYAYEDFVEGLRPTQGLEATEETGPQSETKASSAGFELKSVNGVFRRISADAERARLAARQPVAPDAAPFDLGSRRVFKMSIGRAGSEDYLFDAAIEGGYAALGYGLSLDWSDPKYRNYDEFRRRVTDERPGTTGYSAEIKQVWPFLEMKPYDVIVVSKGNALIRAIGLVTGEYYHEPNEPEFYDQRRPVNWLLVPKDPIPADTIYEKSLTQSSCYELRPDLLNRAALERLLSEASGHDAGATDRPSQSGASRRPNQFVLVIDEINRANISKLFGELITLLEPDKRLGEGNALTVTLPYSHKKFGVPSNLHLLGTMNTADRSIALLDTALRRRFDFIELMPDPERLRDAEASTGVPLVAMLRAINDRIEYLFDREHQIGHAFFMGCRSRDDVDAVMRRKVIPLLAEYFFEDWQKIASVLGDVDGTRFLERKPLNAPPGLSDDAFAENRLRWTVRAPFADNAYDIFR